MFTFTKDIFGIFKIFDDIYKRLKYLLVPETAYSWQTLIYLSLFSWLMSSFAIGGIKDIIAFFGWVFLIAGTAWYTTDKPILVPGTPMPIGAVITGGLVSVFAFGNQDPVNTTNNFWELPVIPAAIVFWPTISALITAVPEFFEGSGVDVKAQLPKTEIRQRMIVLLACCMVLSCWLRLYFVTDNWLRQYPTLQADNNLGRSGLTVMNQQQNSQSRSIPVNGKIILDKLSPQVERRLTGRPWADAEKWLFDSQKNVSALGAEVIQRNLSQYEEKDLWSAEARVSNPNPKNKDEYKLDLLSVWNGPISKSDKAYYLQKSCRVSPVARAGKTSPRPEDRVIVAEIECDRVSKLIPGPLPPRQ
jgi:Family of unknown function (DUF5357)